MQPKIDMMPVPAINGASSKDARDSIAPAEFNDVDEEEKDDDAVDSSQQISLQTITDLTTYLSVIFQRTELSA